ncbi:MAG: alkane 1-monooxygenase [Ferruginibacter sp.]
MNPLNFSRLLLLPLLVLLSALAGGWWIFITPAICFVIHPLANLIIKRKQHPIDDHASIVKTNKYFRWVAMLYVPVLIALTFWAIYFVSYKPGFVLFAGLALSVGIINGVLGFTLAHEFIHARNTFTKSCGYILLLQNFYMHYGIEHIGGHHVYACTPADPHTARIGESFFRFLPRAIAKTFVNAMVIEKRYRIKNYTYLNRVFIFLALQILLLAIIFLTSGWLGAAFFLLQSFIAIVMLHNINYLQHYGLLRKEVITGQRERISAHHAWNTNNQLSGFNLFQLENHADHHMHPSHKYEELQALESSPQYPTGYSGMMLLTLIPPLWFKIIHPKISLNTKNNCL